MITKQEQKALMAKRRRGLAILFMLAVFNGAIAYMMITLIEKVFIQIG